MPHYLCPFGQRPMENYALGTQSHKLHEKFHFQSMFLSLSAGMFEHPNVRTCDIY